MTAAVLSTIAIGATVASAGLGVVSAISTANANSQAASYQAQIAKNNAAIQQQNADRAIQVAQQNQQQQDLKSAYLYGQQVATQSASGLSLGGSSFVLTRRSSREIGRLDAENIRQAGDVDAYNYKTLSDQSEQAATFYDSEASNDQLEGYLGAASSIIGGAGKIAGQVSFQSPTIGSAWVPGGWGSSALAG